MGQYGLNKQAVVNGIPLGGTTPEVLQQILAAQYVNTPTNPIIGGGYVTGNGGLTYNVSAGVGLMKTGFGAMMLSWAAGQTRLVQTPSTTRTDVVVVDASGQIDVLVESSFDESKYIVLDRRILPAGATATSRSTTDRRRNYAIPYGGNLGWFGAYVEIRSGIVPRPERMVEMPFWVPTDRRVDFYIEHAIFGRTRPNDTGPEYWPDSDARWLGVGACRYQVFLDNVPIRTHELGYDRTYGGRGFQIWAVDVLQGEHKLRVERVSTWGREPIFFGAGTEKLSPGFVGIRDAGVMQ